MAITATITGIAIILIGLRDMFHSLLHPRGKGAISHAVLSGIWKFSRVTGHRLGSAVGPAGMLAVVVLWVVLQGVGWALVYAPHVPAGFTYSPGIDPARYPDFIEALYVSLINLATLGFGDVVPIDPWIRWATPLQALTGFGLLTAALTWFTQVYPPLSRRRALALDLNALAKTDYARTIPTLEPSAVARVLEVVAEQVNKTTVDLAQNTESYYFQEQAPELSLARQLPYTVALRDAALVCSSLQLHAGARVLDQSLGQLATKLKDFGNTGDDLDAIFSAYAADHIRTPRT
ncbi:potassium channel family protein [Citricoccus alkalitolerans]|uniref:Potassium channel family protein n=1 Tax=Citricoccus alkalitolerans TaxID=246603 RepID=A0ABV8XZI1_9MICC